MKTRFANGGYEISEVTAATKQTPERDLDLPIYRDYYDLISKDKRDMI